MANTMPEPLRVEDTSNSGLNAGLGLIATASEVSYRGLLPKSKRQGYPQDGTGEAKPDPLRRFDTNSDTLAGGSADLDGQLRNY